MDKIKAEALRLGFVHCSATTADPPQYFHKYSSWLQAGYNAGMDYLARPDQIARRQEPRLLMENVRSILVLAAPYPRSDSTIPCPPGSGRVSSYAWGQDYHTILKQKSVNLCQWLCALLERPVENAIFTDSTPVSERELACRAGLGWIGKNTCLISPSFGSYFFLAEVLLDIDLPTVNTTPQDRCGSCRRCIEACPTHCLNEDRTLDARKCISYLTIENKGDIPAELRPQMDGWIFGCDICQQVCPWNQRNTTIPLPEFSTTPLFINIADILDMSEAEFRSEYKSSPILRAKRFGMMRNAIVAAANQKYAGALDALLAIQHNDPNEVLRSLAAWAVETIPARN